MLILNDSLFINKGSSRALYKHPTDKNKAIKIVYKHKSYINYLELIIILKNIDIQDLLKIYIL